MRALDLSPQGFPMAPSETVWASLDEQERAEVYATLPGEVTEAEMAPPEGDRHFRPKIAALDALEGFFKRQGRKVYLAAELPIYYPATPRFAPDLLAVLDVEDAERDKWVVSAEGRGLDWVLEVHVGGDRKKDAERNVARYAALGIPEYFLYDRARGMLRGHRLEAPTDRVYTPVLPQGGRYASRVLGLDVQIEGGRLRFLSGTAVVLSSAELIGRLEDLVSAAEARADEQAMLREQESRRAEDAEREVARLREELARTRGRG